MRTPLVRTSFVTLALALGLSACSDPDVTREDLVSMLTEQAGDTQGEFSKETANCIADIIFEDGKFSQDELNKAALNPDHEDVPEFQPAVDAALTECGVTG